LALVAPISGSRLPFTDSDGREPKRGWRTLLRIRSPRDQRRLNAGSKGCRYFHRGLILRNGMTTFILLLCCLTTALLGPDKLSVDRVVVNRLEKN